MDVREALYTTRAMRRVKPDPIPADVQARILDAAIRAPSGGNSQGWRFLLVDDPEVKAKLGPLYRDAIGKLWEFGYRDRLERARATPGDPESASLLRVQASAQHLADHFESVPLFLIAFSRGDESGGSIFPAVWSAQLAARAEGVGSALTSVLGIFHGAAVMEILGVPAARAGRCPAASRSGTPPAAGVSRPGARFTKSPTATRGALTSASRSASPSGRQPIPDRAMMGYWLQAQIRRPAGRASLRSTGRSSSSAARAPRARPGGAALLICLVAAALVAVLYHPGRHHAPSPPPVSVTNVGHPILAVKSRYELFGLTSNGVVAIDFARGQITKTVLPQAEGSAPVSLILGSNQVIVRPLDNVPGYVVPDG